MFSKKAFKNFIRLLNQDDDVEYSKELKEISIYFGVTNQDIIYDLNSNLAKNKVYTQKNS